MSKQEVIQAADYAKEMKKAKRERYEVMLANQLKFYGYTGWVREYKFCATRKFRFDFAWPLRKIAVEIDGGAFSRGRHVRPAGFIKDCEKFNLAAELGWRVYRFIPSQVVSGEAFNRIKQELYKP